MRKGNGGNCPCGDDLERVKGYGDDVKRHDHDEMPVLSDDDDDDDDDDDACG